MPTLREKVLAYPAREVFCSLVKATRPRVICDVGSLDGQVSVLFKKLRPSARVVAFEANPANYARITVDDRVGGSGVECVHAAVADHGGVSPFFVLNVPDDKQWAAGSSSIRRRASETQMGLVETEVVVNAVRLDEYFRDEQGPIALWIDVEGAAREVLEGASAILDRVTLIYVELENVTIWTDQSTSGEVVSVLGKFGFRELGRTLPNPVTQQNVLLVRDSVRVSMWLVFLARLQRLFTESAERFSGGFYRGAATKAVMGCSRRERGSPR